MYIGKAVGSVCPRFLFQKTQYLRFCSCLFELSRMTFFLNLNLTFLRLLIILTIMTKIFIEQLSHPSHVLSGLCTISHFISTRFPWLTASLGSWRFEGLSPYLEAVTSYLTSRSFSFLREMCAQRQGQAKRHLISSWGFDCILGVELQSVSSVIPQSQKIGVGRSRWLPFSLVSLRFFAMFGMGWKWG